MSRPCPYTTEPFGGADCGLSWGHKGPCEPPASGRPVRRSEPVQGETTLGAWT